MLRLSRSKEVFERNRRFIPGGASSLNRVVPPEIAFKKALGSRIWDVDGHEYIDYHAAFGPHLLGYGCAEVMAAVRSVLDESVELGAPGPVSWKVKLPDSCARTYRSSRKWPF